MKYKGKLQNYKDTQNHDITMYNIRKLSMKNNKTTIHSKPSQEICLPTQYGPKRSTFYNTGIWLDAFETHFLS